MNKESVSENFQKIFTQKSNSVNKTTLTRANENYNKLLAKGVIKKRGYTLRGIEDAHLLRLTFNGK